MAYNFSSTKLVDGDKRSAVRADISDIITGKS